MEIFLKQTIPIWRSLFAESGVHLNQILSANSYFGTSAQLIDEQGKELGGIQREDSLILFDITSNGIKFTEASESGEQALLDAKVAVDFYGELSLINAITISTLLTTHKWQHIFIKNQMGVSSQVELNSAYEDVNGVRLLRAHLEIKFNYIFKIEQQREIIENINHLNLRGIYDK